MCKLLVNPHGFPFVHALWSFPKVNISLFVPLVIKVIPKCSQPNTRDARVRANKIVSLYVTYLSKISSFPPPFRFNKITHCLGITKKTIPRLWMFTVKSISNQRTNLGCLATGLP